MGWIFSRLPDGGLKLHLGANEREVLQSLPSQLATVLRVSPEEPALARLAPPAYVQEPEHEAEYRNYMGDDLRDRKLAALAVMEESAGATVLTPEQAEGWLSALNSLRLVLGTQLDVGEDVDEEFPPLDDHDAPGGRPPDRDDPRVPALALYRYLSLLLEDLVEVMSESLPEVEEEP